MADIFWTEPSGILIKTTLVDFPGRVASTFFLKGCNLRCPYCYNHQLVLLNGKVENLVSLEELFAHLEKRKNVLTGLVISGGEPLLNQKTKEIIRKAKALGYKIKLDTNGTLSSLLSDIISNPELKPDFIAIDLKTSPARYNLLTASTTAKLNYEKEIKNTLNLIKENYTPENYEIRTVLVPGLVNTEDIKCMAEIIPLEASWKFAAFENHNCLDVEYTKISPYTKSEMEDLVSYAKNFVKDSSLR
ncbi:MAG: anaerobic ribonucleoside-triphosphate reductase activating protein [Treponema sp.]|nr:anaerobic ribonucleoside-triphosphate reductase activating protein [Treponema sp.]